MRESRGFPPCTTSTTQCLASPSKWSWQRFRIPDWPKCAKKKIQQTNHAAYFFVSCGPCSDIILHGQGAKSSFWHRTYNPSCGWQNHSRMIPAWNWVKITSPSVSLLATRWQPEHDIKGFKFKKAACSGHTAYMARETET